MSVCNYTQYVSPNTCLGDSLATFNANFSALDDGLCRVPDVVSGSGLKVISEISEQNHFASRVSTKNSFVYGTSFDYKSLATIDNIPLSDGTTAAVTTFPDASANQQAGPLATFSTISLTNNPPKVTLFWTASGSNNLTVYATNSANSVNNRGPIGFNGSVTSMISSGNLLYVGGDFTTVGGVDCKKFCAINISSGNSDPTLGLVGTLAGNPLSAYGDLGTYGTVHAIAEYGDLLIVGGSFQSTAKGRGLTILDKVNGTVYPFYVNGVVNDLCVIGTNLYVGGTFDYINYDAQSRSINSGLRVYTNGLMKISLPILIGFPSSSFDKAFAASITKLFTGPSTINALATKSGNLYIGGSFEVKGDSSLNAKNIAIITAEGSQLTSWKPFIGGPVYTLSVDGDYLYVGGDFRSFHTQSQFFSNPRINDASTEAYNALSFSIVTATPVLQTNWKPVFNGAVTKFAFHDNTFGSYVYCYGNFTQVNGNSVNYIAAIEKSYNNQKTGTDALWKVGLQKAPELINQGLVRYANSIIIGGTFTEIDNENRFYLARVNGVSETMSTNSLSSIVWNVGAQLCAPGTSLKLDLTNFVSTTAYPSYYGVVNQTTITFNNEEFNNLTEGNLIRFFVQRPKVFNLLNKPVYVLGWKVDFNE